jgi:aerobic-type carbon monoxide dehydrogenase small subunit (CoxS/CutS family)
MEIVVNGNAYQVADEPDRPLLWVLRDELGLTGTKFGCGVGLCGSCEVHLDGAAAFLEENSNPTEKEIASAMNSNYCRCGTYGRIKRAVATAAREMVKSGGNRERAGQ